VTGSSTFNSSNIWVDPKTGIDYPMGVQFSEKEVSNFKQLADFPVRAQHRERTTPLGNIATLTKTLSPTQINHVDFRRVIDIYLSSQDRDIGGLSNDIEKIVRQTAIPSGYSISVRGEIAAMKKSII